MNLGLLTDIHFKYLEIPVCTGVLNTGVLHRAYPLKVEILLKTVFDKKLPSADKTSPMVFTAIRYHFVLKNTSFLSIFIFVLNHTGISQYLSFV